MHAHYTVSTQCVLNWYPQLIVSYVWAMGLVGTSLAGQSTVLQWAVGTWLRGYIVVDPQTMKSCTILLCRYPMLPRPLSLTTGNAFRTSSGPFPQTPWLQSGWPSSLSTSIGQELSSLHRTPLLFVWYGIQTSGYFFMMCVCCVAFGWAGGEFRREECGCCRQRIAAKGSLQNWGRCPLCKC